MSSSRDAPTKPDSVAFEPATKREFFQASKYSDIVGVITTTAVKTSDASGVHFSPAACRSLAVFSKSVVTAWRKSASGSGLAEGDLAVAVEIGLHALGRELVLGAEDRRLREEEEVAGLLVLLARLRLDRERDGVLRIARVAARVDGHVVVGELGHAGDDALHLLVRGVGRAEVGLQLLDDRRDLVGVLGRAARRSRSRRSRRGRSTAGRPRGACPSRSRAARCARPGSP